MTKETRLALKNLVEATEGFRRYVNTYSDPMEDEASVVKLRKALKEARGLLKRAEQARMGVLAAARKQRV
jgi:hypothetical protein